MIADLKQHRLAYLILITYTLFSFWLFFGFQIPAARFQIMLFYLLFLLTWAIIHHAVEKSLSFLVLLEYLLIIGGLGFITLKIIFFPLL